jgi:hypothetical protein
VSEALSTSETDATHTSEALSTSEPVLKLLVYEALSY